MRIAVMQPTYLPWLGYFNLICSVEAFVLLDDAQFEKGTWHQRNRVIQADRMTWLTVPVFTKGYFGQAIMDAKIKNDAPWRRAHAGTLLAAYGRSPYKDLILDFAGKYDGFDFSSICDLNIHLIQSILDILEIKPNIIRASEMNVSGKRSDRLLQLCQVMGASEYLSPRGARDYIEADGVFEREGFPVIFQDFSPPIYRDAAPLHAGEFPSILDAIAHIGPAATKALIMEERYGL